MCAVDHALREFITIDKKRIAYITAGDPALPAVILVHGWLSFAGIWDQTIEALQANHYCVAVELLGHGYSDKPRDGDYSIAGQSRRVLALADALGLEKFTFIGHSMGGQIGLYLALHAPERLTRMISVSGVVTGKLTPYVRYGLKPIYWMGSVFPFIWGLSRFALRYRWYRLIFDRALYYDPSQFPYDTLDRKMALMHGNEIPAYRDLQAIDRADQSLTLAQIRVPVRVIFGKEDGTVPVQDGIMVEQCVPGTRLSLIDQCGHVPMRERPEAYLTALRAALAE